MMLSASKTVQPRGGGEVLEKGDMDVRQTDPFFTSLRHSTRPPFQHISVPQGLFLTKNYKIFKFSAKNT